MGSNPRKRPEMLEIMSFANAASDVYRGSHGIKILSGPKIVCYNPRNGQKSSKSRVLSTLLESCTEGHMASKFSRDPKSWVPTHENGQKCSKSRVLPTLLESCTGSHMSSKSSRDRKSCVLTHENGLGSSKCSRDPKIVGYNQRKRPEMLKLKSLADAARVV